MKPSNLFIISKALILFLLLSIKQSFSQTTSSAIASYLKKNDKDLIKEYLKFLALPNVSSDTPNIQKNAQYLLSLMNSYGIKSQILNLNNQYANPIVYGEVITPGAKQTIGLYAHYDAQPVDSTKWSKGLHPFKPKLLTNRIDKDFKELDINEVNELQADWRIYARSSSDDKAGVFSALTAYKALKETGAKLKVNIKFLFEGEEEVGSIHLSDYFSQYKDLLKADVWVIADGPRNQRGDKQLALGVRGDVNIELKLYGPNRPLHSGNYGNWAPNPAMRLVQLLASMKDDKGKVLIKGFYDDVTPLTEEEKKWLKSLPSFEAGLMKDLGLSAIDGDGKSYYELMHLPTLNINGIQSGGVGRLAANIIPTEATVVLDLRLVAGNDVDRQIQKVVEHIKKHGYEVVFKEPTAEEKSKHARLIYLRQMGKGYNAQRTPAALPIVQKIYKALQQTHPSVLLIPTMGGSLPLYVFEKDLKTFPVTVSITNFDSNQHGENENIQLKYLWEGVESIAAILMIE